MNPALCFLRVSKTLLTLSVSAVVLTACGYKGPLVMPPEPYANQSSVEKIEKTSEVKSSAQSTSSSVKATKSKIQ